MQFIYHPESSLRKINLTQMRPTLWKIDLYTKGTLIQSEEATALPQALTVVALLMSEYGMHSHWSMEP